MIRMSYPDLVEDRGNYYLTETQKDVARVHPINRQFLEQLWAQSGNKKRTEEGLLTGWSDKTGKFPQKAKVPSLADFSVRDTESADYRSKNQGKGFTIDIAFALDDLREGQVLLDARGQSEKGWHLRTTAKKTIEIVLNDGRTQSVWACDEGLLKENKTHYVSVIVDGGPRIISFIVDGKFNDGGDTRQFGWGRFNPYLQSVAGGDDLVIGSGIRGTVKKCKDLRPRTDNLGGYRQLQRRPVISCFRSGGALWVPPDERALYGTCVVSGWSVAAGTFLSGR